MIQDTRGMSWYMRVLDERGEAYRWLVEIALEMEVFPRKEDETGSCHEAYRILKDRILEKLKEPKP